MKNFPKKITVQSAVHPDTASAIRRAAARENISISELIRRILEEVYPAVSYVAPETQKKRAMIERRAA